MRSSLVVLVLLALVGATCWWFRPQGLLVPQVSHGFQAERSDYTCTIEVSQDGVLPPLPADCALLARVDARAPADTVARLGTEARRVGQTAVDLEVVARVEAPPERKSGPKLHRLEPGARAVEAERVLIVPPDGGQHAQIAQVWSNLLALGVREIAVAGEVGAGTGTPGKMAAPGDVLWVHRLRSPDVLPARQ